MKAVLLVTLLLGCSDVPQPYELDHARVMAVRVEPPTLAPGDSARVDVLLTDATEGPRIALPSSYSVTALGVAVNEREDGWIVTAPSTAADAIVALALEIDSDEGTLVAQKTLAIGVPAANPSPPEILLDGEARALSMPSDRESTLSVVDPDAEMSYRWFSSVGELTGYTRDEARLDPDADARGFIVVVVRDQAGGTAWTLATAEVGP